MKKHKHKKRVIRFIIFFLFLLSFGIIEDLTSISLSGIEFNMVILLTVIIVATIFTVIAEITEIIVKKEEPKIEKIIRKEENIIKKDEKIIKKKLKI